MSFYDNLSPKNQLNFENPKEVQTSSDPSKSYFFYGGKGCGKTFSAIQHAKKFIEKTGITDREELEKMRFIKFFELVKIAQNSFGDKNENWENRQLLHEIKTSFYLILDDIGTEKQTPFVDQLIYEIIDWRYENECITIFTSNFNLQEIGEKYHARMASRITEICGTKQILNGGDKDYRLENDLGKKINLEAMFLKNTQPLQTDTQIDSTARIIGLLAGVKNINPKLYENIKNGVNKSWNEIIIKNTGIKTEQELVDIYHYSETLALP